MLDTILSRSYEWQDDFDEERPENLVFHGDEFADLPLFEEEDILILMHRDAHFSGSFSAMEEYYSNPDAKGVVEEVDLTRISFLKTIQDRLKHDLAPILITGPNAEKVAYAKQIYSDLRELTIKDPSSPEGILASAILSEEPIDELVDRIEATVAQKPGSLLLLATSDLFSDALFPGYGTAPILAIRLLGRVHHEPAIHELFYLLGRRGFEIESALLAALREIGEPTKQFAIKQVSHFPITEDNERSALVLLEFLPDETIASIFKALLADTRVSNPTLKNYLLIGLENSCAK